MMSGINSYLSLEQLEGPCLLQLLEHLTQVAEAPGGNLQAWQHSTHNTKESAMHVGCVRHCHGSTDAVRGSGKDTGAACTALVSCVSFAWELLGQETSGHMQQYGKLPSPAKPFSVEGVQPQAQASISEISNIFPAH
jgi:hypothetical protein